MLLLCRVTASLIKVSASVIFQKLNYKWDKNLHESREVLLTAKFLSGESTAVSPLIFGLVMYEQQQQL